MTEQEYRSLPGLSNSALKDLAVSPLRFWHRHINPNRPKDEPTPEMQFGSALHCAVLEPEAFLDRYACEVCADDYPGCLVTMEDLRGFIKDKGQQPKGTRKADAIAQAQAIDPSVPILEVIERQHFGGNRGKVIFKKQDWARIYGAAESLRSEPRIKEIMTDGMSEVPMFAKDPDTDVQLKARMDFVAAKFTLDLKTFTRKASKSIDKSVTDAIFYEGYHKQGYLYQKIRRIALNEAAGASEFVLAFVESDPPHEVRLRSIQPKFAGNATLLWERARIEVSGLIRIYADCMKEFGVERPWRYAQEVTPLADEEVPSLAY